MSITSIDYAARVRRGAALLDRVRPGWAREIDRDRLAMESCDRCILGQLWGDYFDGVCAIEDIAADPRAAIVHGFDATSGEARRDFPPLAAAWRDAIRERLASEDASS